MELPTFYIEHYWRVHDSPTGARDPLWNHNLYKFNNVVPEIKLGLDYYNGHSIVQMVGEAYDEINYFKDKFLASGNVSMNAYAFNLFAFGRGSTDHSFWLLHNSGDLLSGRPSGEGYLGNESYFAPWANSGILQNATWVGNFISEFNNYVNNSGLMKPSVFDFTGENFGDDYAGFVGGGTGWVTRALADARSSSHSFHIDGDLTFQQYWAAAKMLDGSDVPAINTGVAIPANPLQKSNNPVNFPIQEKWRGARRRCYDYAMYTAFSVPMKAILGDIPIVEYLMHSDSYANPVLETPGPSGYSMYQMSGVFRRDWQGWGWYGDLNLFTDASTFDLDNNYDWRSETPWYTKYPRPASSAYTQYEYAALQRAKRYVYDLVQTAPNKPVCMWISLLSAHSNYSAMLEFVKYAYDLGIRRFFCWENGYFINSNPSMYDTWYSFVNDVNNYVYSLNPAIIHRTSTVSRLGGGYFKF